MDDSPTDVDSSRDVSQDQSEDSCRNITRSFEENFASVGEQASDASLRWANVSGKHSNKYPTPSSQIPNDCSHNEDAFILPRRQPIPSSMSVLGGMDGSNAKTYQKDLSPFAASSNADFASPNEHGTTPVNRWLSKNLKETNAPSQEKRCVETDADSIPVKRLRKTPESDSGKHGTKTEYTPKLSHSEVSETFYKSLTNLHFQQMKIAIENNEESGSPNSTSTPFKRKRKITRNSSVESKTANDTTVSISISPSSAANIIDKSPNDLQMLGSKVDRSADESSTERKTIFGDSLADSNSLENHSNPPDLLQTTSLLFLPKEELESISDELTDASSNNPNLKTRRQKGTRSSSGMPDTSALGSKNTDGIMHPTTLIDNSLYRPINVPGKQRDVLPPEVLPTDLPVKETESTVHRLALNDKTSNSNSRQASESQISKIEGLESNIKGKKIRNSASVSAKETQSASNVADSSVETHILESSQSSPIILNPHLPSSCHLPRQSNSSVTNVPGSTLEFNTSVKKGENDRNRSDYSTRTSTPERKSRSQSKKLSSLRCRGIHRRSVSDETLTTRNLNEVQAERNQPNSAIRSQSKQAQTSRSFPEISKSISERISIGKPLFRKMIARCTSNTASATGNTREFSHSCRSNQLTQPLASNELSATKNDPEQQMHQNRNAALLQNRHAILFSGDSSRSRNRANDTSPLHINVFEGQASTSTCQPIVAVTSSSVDQAFASRNQPKEMSNVNPTDINLSKRHPSTSVYQLTATGGFFHNESPFPTSRNEPAMEELFTARDQSSTEDSSSSDDSLDSSEPPSPSDVQPEKHSECVVQARMLLQSVLKEIMLYNKEDFKWTLFEKSFRHISKPYSELVKLNLIEDLSRYLVSKAYDFFDTTLFSDYEMAEKHTVAVFGKLTVIVVDALAFTLSVGSSRAFFGLLIHHVRFKSLYRNFSSYWDVFDVKSIRDEASRKRVKTLRQMIQRLMLVVLAAFRLLLMYVGENISGIYFGMFELELSGEDKIYFGRNIS